MRDPTAEPATRGTKGLAPRIDTLEGKRIGLHVNAKEAAEPVSEVIAERLRERHDDIEFTYCDVLGRNETGLDQIEHWADQEADTCIASVGDCGGCTRAVVRTANAIEEAGTPAVGLVAEGFEASWEANAEDQGRHLRYQELPIRSETTDKDVLREQLGAEEIQGIERALTESLIDEERGLETKDTTS